MKKTIIKSTAIIFVLSLTAKLIGFLKSMVMASYFGAGLSSDAYYFANSIVTDILYMIATSIGLSFLPVYIHIREQKGRNEAKKYTGETVCLMSIVAIIITVIVIIIAPGFIHLIAPSYTGEQLSNTILYLRIMAVGTIFSLMTSIYQNLLNAEKIYGYSNLASIINSVVLIGMIVVLSTSMGIMAAVIAVPISYVIQYLVLTIRSKKFVQHRLTKNPWNINTKVLINQALPILFSNATVELNQMVDRILLVSIGEGAVTAVNYSAVLFQLAANVISIPISTVVFTEFAEQAANDNKDGMRSMLKETLHVIFLICIPVTIIMIFHATPIVNIVYGRGNYTEYAVNQTAIGLLFYSFCLIPTCIRQIMTKVFYSMNDTKIPMILSILEVALNTGLSIILAHYVGLTGVVAGTAIAGVIFAFIQIAVFNYKKLNIHLRSEIVTFLKMMISTAGIIVVSFFIGSSNQISIFSFIGHSILIFAIFYGLMFVLKDLLVNTIFRKSIDVLKRKIHK